MRLNHHRLPADTFDALAAGGGGPAAIEMLRRSQHSKHALLLRGVAAADAPHSQVAYDLLTSAQQKDPAQVEAVIRHPSVGAWAHRTILALRGGPRLPGAVPDGLAAVAAAAAVRTGVAGEIEVPVLNGLVTLPSLGAAEAPGTGMATIRITPEGTRVRADCSCITIPPDHRALAPGWRPLRPVLAGAGEATRIVLDDIDPFRMPVVPDLVPVPEPSCWRSMFTDAWILLRQHHPGVATEVAEVIATVVPRAAPPHGHVSSSSPETFGAIALSEPRDPVDLAVTLAHEVQHMKLSAVLDLVPLIHPEDGSRYYAPWREDPRPTSGLLQGAYAFLAVTGFWRRQRHVTAADSVADTEFARWRTAVAYVCGELLASGQLTDGGVRFVQTMARTLRPWCDEPVSDKAQRLADEENERHLARWTAAHGPVPSFG